MSGVKWRSIGLLAASFTGFLGLATIGVVYVLTGSGTLVLALSGVGVLLATVGGAAGNRRSTIPGAQSHSFGAEGETISVKSDRIPAGTFSGKYVLIFYGTGLCVWGLLLLVLLII